jgi:hypothetical protein
MAESLMNSDNIKAMCLEGDCDDCLFDNECTPYDRFIPKDEVECENDCDTCIYDSDLCDNIYVTDLDYMDELMDAEEEIATRNSSGTSIERLKSKFPDKNFI